MKYDLADLSSEQIEELIEGFAKTSLVRAQEAYDRWRLSKKKRTSLVPDISLLSGLSGLSPSSVSNWNRDVPGAVSAETKDCLDRLAGKLGYRPSRAASQLRRKRTNTFAVILPLTGVSTFFHRVLIGIKEAAIACKTELLIFDVVSLEERDQLMRELPFLGLVDGIITVGLHMHCFELDELLRRNIPVVSVLRSFEHPAVVASVVSNRDERVVEHVVAHFVTKHGCRDLALVSLRTPNALRMGMAREGRAADDPFRKARIRGFEKAIERFRKRHQVRHKKIFIDSHTGSQGHEAFQKACKWYDKEHCLNPSLEKGPMAVICMSDPVAVAVQTLARRQQNPRIVCSGFDDSWVAEACAITSVPQPGEEMGKHAALQLYACLRHAEDTTFPLPARRTFNLNLPGSAIRFSCGCGSLHR